MPLGWEREGSAEPSRRSARPEQAGLKAGTGMLVGPLKVELAGVAKSTWNFHRFNEFDA